MARSDGASSSSLLPRSLASRSRPHTSSHGGTTSSLGASATLGSSMSSSSSMSSTLRPAHERLEDYKVPDLHASHSRRLARRGEVVPRRALRPSVSAGGQSSGGLFGHASSSATSSISSSAAAAGGQGMLASGSTLAHHGGLADRCNSGFVHHVMETEAEFAMHKVWLANRAREARHRRTEGEVAWAMERWASSRGRQEAEIARRQESRRLAANAQPCGANAILDAPLPGGAAATKHRPGHHRRRNPEGHCYTAPGFEGTVGGGFETVVGGGGGGGGGRGRGGSGSASGSGRRWRRKRRGNRLQRYHVPNARARRQRGGRAAAAGVRGAGLRAEEAEAAAAAEEAAALWSHEDGCSAGVPGRHRHQGDRERRRRR